MGINLAFIGNNTETDNIIKQIPIENLIPYHNHNFKLYEGERLDDMVQSIKQNGVITPIIVRPLGEMSGNYEILAGHNRTNAAKLAKLATVPAIIKDNLTDEEAEIYVVETNLIQRGFSDLAVSEQAAVVAMRYTEIFDKDKVAEIHKEIENLDNNVRPVGERRSDKAVAQEYGLSGRTVSRLLRINSLKHNIKKFIDRGELSVRAGVELSYISDYAQGMLYLAVTDDEGKLQHKIDIKTAERIRAVFADKPEEEIEEDSFDFLFEFPYKPSVKPLKLELSFLLQYFDKDVTQDEMLNTIDRALKKYLKK
jgi:ParB family chromosome partitioning protein